MRTVYLATKAYEGEDGERWINGWATTPDVDLSGDSVDPKGADYRLPIPLLFSHDYSLPVGAVTEATVSEAGIRIRARLSKGVQKAEEVWQLLKDGALNAVSIGFRGLQYTPIKGGGKRFSRWHWMECSIVAVPCNPNARIAVGKALAYDTKSDVDGSPEARLEKFLKSCFDRAETLKLDRSSDYVARAAGQAKSNGKEDPVVAVRKSNYSGLCWAIDAMTKQLAVTSMLASTALERVFALENYGIRYVGNWQRANAYKRGNVATHKGSAWIVTAEATEAEPGESADWQLMVKAGRDAR